MAAADSRSVSQEVLHLTKEYMARREAQNVDAMSAKALLELAGIRNVLSKSYGSRNHINMVKAAADALRTLKNPEEVARLRGKTVQELYE